MATFNLLEPNAADRRPQIVNQRGDLRKMERNECSLFPGEPGDDVQSKVFEPSCPHGQDRRVYEGKSVVHDHGGNQKLPRRQVAEA